MKKIIYLLPALLVLLSCGKNDFQQAEESITYADIERHLATLSDDSFLGRKPFTQGETKSLKYLETEYKRIGLKPAYGDSYFQDVPLMEVFGDISDELEITKAGESLKLKKVSEFSAFSRRVQDKIDIANTDLVFAGYGIIAPEYNWNDYSDIDVKGKIVVVLVNDPGYGTKNDSFFKGHAMTYYGRWTYKYEEAARQGAKGCLIVHQTGPAGYPWDVVKKGIESSKLYLQDKDGYKNRCELEGWLTLDAAKKLFQFTGKDLDAEMATAKAGKLKAYAMEVQANLNINQRFNYDVSKNVIGVVEGTSRKDEAIVFTAHWDHLGVVDPVNGDSIVNGATDNASALAWMMEIAEAFTKLKQKPERSLVFIAVTAEESGLLGSYHYVANPLFAPEKTVAIFNTDVNLFLGKYKDVTITGHGQSELDDWVAEAAKTQNRYILPDQSPDNGMYFRSDHFPFAKVGVPAMFGKGYSDHIEKGKEWTLNKVDEYWKNTYHKPSDEYHAERDDLNGLLDDTRLFFQVAYKLSMSDQFPKWKEGSEFKSVREKSMK